MNKIPAWMPNLDSWMSAFLLLILANGLGKFAQYVVKNYSDFFSDFSTVSLIILLLLFILSPIIAIAIVHHFICIILDVFSPTTQRRKMLKNSGLLPGLISWWEGWFGWQALLFTLVLSTAIEFIFFASQPTIFSENYWLGKADTFFTKIMFVRLIIMAFVYQFEYSVRKYLISLGSE